jgi:hypothetical protein
MAFLLDEKFAKEGVARETCRLLRHASRDAQPTLLLYHQTLQNYGCHRQPKSQSSKLHGFKAPVNMAVVNVMLATTTTPVGINTWHSASRPNEPDKKGLV